METHEKNVRREADVSELPLAETARLGARVADGAAVVDSGGIGLGGAGIELLEFGADPPGGLNGLGQRTSSLLFVVSLAGVLGWNGDSNPLILV